MTEIKPIFVVSDRDITFSIEYENKKYPIAILDTPNASIAWKKFQLGIAQINEIRKDKGEPEITYRPTLQATIEAAMIGVKTEFESTKNNTKTKKEESKKSKTRPCECGGTAYLDDDGKTYMCAMCGMLTKNGRTLDLPWKEEVEKKDFVKCTSEECFMELLKFWEDHMVFQNKAEYLICTMWDIHTYLIRLFNSTMYLKYSGAGNDKGKTRALEIHAEFAYRGMLVSSGTTDAAYKLALTKGATLIIDQAENAFFEGRKKTLLYNIFTSGYRRGIPIVQTDMENRDEFVCRASFGAKSYCMQDDGFEDNAIYSRTKDTHMLRGRPRIKNFRGNKESEERIERIRRMLAYIASQSIPEYDKETGLSGRTADMYDPLIMTCRILKLPQWIENALFIDSFEFDDEKRNYAEDTFPAVVLLAFQNNMYNHEQIMPGELREWIINWALENKKADRWNEKTPELKSEKIGRLLSDMGLEKKKKNKGNAYATKSDKNLALIFKISKQYQEDESIVAKVERIESKIAENMRVSGTPYEKYLRYRHIETLQELAEKIREEGVVEDNIPYIEPPQEEDIDPDPDFAEYHERHAPFAPMIE